MTNLRLEEREVQLTARSNWVVVGDYQESDIKVMIEAAGRPPDDFDLGIGWGFEWWCQTEEEAKAITKALDDAGVVACYRDYATRIEDHQWSWCVDLGHLLHAHNVEINAELDEIKASNDYHRISRLVRAALGLREDLFAWAQGKASALCNATDNIEPDYTDEGESGPEVLAAGPDRR